MITFEGYGDIIKKVYDHRQDHVFAFWETLDNTGRRELLDDLSEVDFGSLEALYRQARAETPAARDFAPADYIPLPEGDAIPATFAEARHEGTARIKNGKAAAFVVAGGQGTRLGYDGPKGLFPVGAVSNKSLFQIHAEKVLSAGRKYGVSIPWLVMTSRANHQATVDFLEEKRFFGLDRDDVTVFPQNMIPSLDLDGRLILEGPSRLFRNPDGHGGSLTALRSSGALEKLSRRGIDTISYFQVDNPLVKIIDPVFIGFHFIKKAHVSSKGLLKAYPGEKLGVFVRFDDGTTGVVEYSDMPAALQEKTDPDGRLTYRMGSIAIHLFDVDFITSITGETGVTLPYHVARKKIQSFSGVGATEIEGYKFEKFVFDALPLTEKNVILETRREEEFAPVKNRDGVDSVDTSRRLMSELYLRWLRDRGVAVPDSVKTVEISPLLADEAEDLDPGITVPPVEQVYLE